MSRKQTRKRTRLSDKERLACKEIAKVEVMREVIHAMTKQEKQEFKETLEKQLFRDIMECRRLLNASKCKSTMIWNPHTNKVEKL